MENDENLKPPSKCRGRNAAYKTGDNLLSKRFMLKILNSINQHIQEKGVNFNYIAKKLGVSRACVSIMFSGRVVWTFTTLINVCDALDLDFQLVLTPRSVKL